ncbi:MAG TPA: VWA domain-containing protein, partial [Thiolapillus brandeum]|nr:VWA domain-containing protein [Thiolapillus brandeum]
MSDTALHFAQPLWLLAIALLPLVALWLRFSQPKKLVGLESRYADEELLPYLTGEVRGRRQKNPRILGAWMLAWALLSIAMAGPRWDYERISAFQPAAELVILLDISASMNISDVRPSRLARAKQEIQGLLRLNPGIRVGLVAFATVAHVVAPVTEDMETLQRVLPSLSTELVRLPGSRLGNALEKASMLLSNEKADVARHILLITDGDFDEPKLLDKVDELAAKNIHLHVLAVGTEGGGLVPERFVYTAGGRTPVSRLNISQLEALASHGKGLLQIAEYHERDVQKILELIIDDADQQQIADLPTRIWNERFYLPLIPAIFL